MLNCLEIAGFVGPSSASGIASDAHLRLSRNLIVKCLLSLTKRLDPYSAVKQLDTLTVFRSAGISA